MRYGYTMFIYVADENAVYTGEFNTSTRVYRAIRKIADATGPSDACEQFGMVTYWPTLAGRIL